VKRGMTSSVVIPAAIVIAGFAAVIALSSFIDKARPQLPEGYEDSDLTFHGSRVRGFALGSEGLIADWYFMRALQYIGGKMLKNPEMDIDLNDLRPLNPRLLYPLLQNATDLDPHFIAAYSYGAIVMPAIEPNQAIELAKKGVANNPDSWRLYQHLGYIYWKLGRFQEAADAYERGSKVPGAAPFMTLIAAAMKTEGGSRETARTIYRQMLETTDDEQVRITADRRLKQIDSLDERDVIDSALMAFKEKNGRCPHSLADVLPSLADAPTHGGRDLRIDKDRNLVDPSGAPYLLNSEKCQAILDPEKTGIALQ
jgi:tetratricopeptide (TPR) repeat protein